ncbi:hypothetical protein [Polyangium aurulentum]|uniref:hypothetical protein n=1 Tax=Polyangium aurulentum TaxID=2567896 RepID=UPI0010AEA8DE|nr:hypothetical protein [Polyangium aurulentum]UQA60766.1 hypothetical protein E8A73_009905 [Polyangium aurulentum]
MKRAPLLLLAALSLAPATALAEEASTDPYAADPEPPRRSFTLYATAGLTYRSLYGIPILAADLEFSIGGRTRSVDIYGSLGGAIGRTEQGLLAGQLRLGPTFLFPVGDRVRLGLEPRSGWVGIRRITKSQTIGDLSMGIGGIATVDLAPGEEYAIFLGGRIGADYLLRSNGLLFAGTLMLGARH